MGDVVLDPSMHGYGIDPHTFIESIINIVAKKSDFYAIKTLAKFSKGAAVCTR